MLAMAAKSRRAVVAARLAETQMALTPIKSLACSFTLYSYEYEHEGSLMRVNGFWESRRKVRNYIKAHRVILLREGRTTPIPDMRILEIETIPVDRKAIVRLLSEQYDDLDFFFRWQAVIEVVSTPQLPGRHD